VLTLWRRTPPFFHEFVLLPQDRELAAEASHLIFGCLDPHRGRRRAARHQLLLPAAQLLGPQRQLVCHLADRSTQCRDLPHRFRLKLVREGPPDFAHETPPCLEDRGHGGVRQIEATSAIGCDPNLRNSALHE